MIPLLLFLSFIQTIVGIVFAVEISDLFTTGEISFSILIVCFIIAFIIAIIIVFKIREYSNFFALGVEILLSPFALFRILFGLILGYFAGMDFNLKSFNEEPLGAILGFTLYIDISDEASLSRKGNFFTMLLFAFPVAFIMTYSFWIELGLYDWVLNDFGVQLVRYNLFFCIVIILFFSGALCVLRSQPYEYESYNANYKFENRYTGKVEKRYSEEQLELTERSKEVGWRQIGGGFESHLTIQAILTIVFSPILGFTYFIGLIFSFLGIFITPIYSCAGQLDFSDVPLAGLQKVIHFFFGFVINPSLEKEKKKEKKKQEKKPVSKIQSKPQAKPYQSKLTTKTTTKKAKYQKENNFSYAIWKCGKSIKKFFASIGRVLIWPFTAIWKGFKKLGKLASNGGFSILTIFVVIGKILIWPFVKIKDLFSGIRRGGTELSAAPFIIFGAALLIGVYVLIGHTGFVGKLTFETDMSWLTDIFDNYYLTGKVKEWFDGANFFTGLIFTVIIVIVAVLEFILFILSFILSFILVILAFLLQIGYIILIPIGLSIFSIIVFFTKTGETSIIGKLFILLLIIAGIVGLVFYGMDVYQLMFPN